MNCNSFEKLSPFAGQLKGPMKQAFEHHIAICPSCCDIFQRIAAVENALLLTAPVAWAPRKGFSDRVIARLQSEKIPLKGKIASYGFMILSFVVLCHTVITKLNWNGIPSFPNHGMVIFATLPMSISQAVASIGVNQMYLLICCSWILSIFAWLFMRRLASNEP
jgi:hypothetical protein